MRRVIDEFDAPRPDRRGLSAAAPPGGLLRQRPCRRADAVQLRAAVDVVERALNREDHRRLREGACRRAHGRTGCSAITTVRGWRAGSGREQARVAAMLLLTLRGTPTLYYGDEIGMHQVAIAPDQVRDPFEKNVPGDRRRPRRLPHADAMGRDGRMPDFRRRRRGCRWRMIIVQENVVNLDADARSILSLYKALIDLRKRLPQLMAGDYVPIAAEGDLLLYRRQSEGECGGDRAESRCRADFDRLRVRSALTAKSCFRPSSTGKARRSRARSICAAMKA